MPQVAFGGQQQLVSAAVPGLELHRVSMLVTRHFPQLGLVKVMSRDRFGQLKPNTPRVTGGTLPCSPSDTKWDGIFKAAWAKHCHFRSLQL